MEKMGQYLGGTAPPSKARTLGCRAHIPSVLWYLGWARHQAEIKYPASTLLHVFRDAAARQEEHALLLNE